MVTRGYLPLGDLFILSFLHLHFLQPLQHFVPYAKMKCAFRCGFSTQRCIFHWYLHDFMALILPDSCSLKSSFLICSFGRQSMIAANSLVRLAWFGKLLRQTKPQTYNISLGPRPPPGFSLTRKDCGKAFSKLCHQRSMHWVPVTTKPGFFLEATFFANSCLLCFTWNFSTRGVLWVRD